MSIFGCAELDAPLAGVAGFVEHLGDVQQRLRRDASAIQTHAAGILLGIDQRDLHPEVGGIERRRVAPGAGADDCDTCRHDGWRSAASPALSCQLPVQRPSQSTDGRLTALGLTAGSSSPAASP